MKKNCFERCPDCNEVMEKHSEVDNGEVYDYFDCECGYSAFEYNEEDTKQAWQAYKELQHAKQHYYSSLGF